MAKKKYCSDCGYQWSNDMNFKLQKVDFFWINRDHSSFEWFVDLLSQLEMEQRDNPNNDVSRFLDMNLYLTSGLQANDMKTVALKMAMDILYTKEERDLVTGLRARTKSGRPDWDEVFQQIRKERKGKVTVFFCGNSVLASTLRIKCDKFNFNFRKEVF